MAEPTNTLKWSGRLDLAPRSSKLHGDKITLPPSVLEALLNAAPIVAVENQESRPLTTTFDPFNPHTFAAERYAREQFADRQQQLPHPLTFRVVNPENGRAVYAGIREFSAEENEIGLSRFLQDTLGLQASRDNTRDSTPNGDVEMIDELNKKRRNLTVHFKELPKGTYVRLRPLEAGYDPEDWKSLLERYLRDNFTTLTNGEILAIPGARHEQFRFLVDKLEPEGDAICIVDTDLEVDIEALNEEQARETLSRRLAKHKRAPGTAEGSSAGGNIEVGQAVQGQVHPGEYVDYELKSWNRSQVVDVKLDSEEGSEIDVFMSPFSRHQRSRPREDEHLFADFSGRPSKRLRLASTNVELEDAESLYISVHGWNDATNKGLANRPPLTYTLNIRQASGVPDLSENQSTTELATDEVICKNCHQHIPKRTLPLHEAFCYRNNILCPKCNNVFLKSSDAWKQHWHCPHDSEFGLTSTSQQHHDLVFHPHSPLQCPSCEFQAFNLPILAQHRTSTCPAKEILCQFCHLVVPQQGPDDPSFTDPEVLLSGLTPHELTDGARTTECHLCNKIVRLRDMKTHLRLHDRERVLRVKPKLCVNIMCGRTIRSGDENVVTREQLGLCNECFGPLYVTTYDPEGKALRRRIERRLLTQLVGGCNHSYCRNADWCKTAYHNSNDSDRNLTTKDALPLVRPVLDQLTKGDGSGLSFCVDEASQNRMRLAHMMAAENVYEVEWCVKALEEAHGDLGLARTWLEDRAPKIGEVLK